ncbi:THO complex subunit 4D [Capsicum annuum]|uniref:THO complex subunit 4D n=1 Tax=Capsicum annuum TaxID=4072 RepID=A0A2G2Y4P8_CAPAN|nr:THO complex subunit 4D [Capsicum annuum]
MGSRLGRRVVNFANLPIKLLMPSSFSNITEIALKTIPAASKIEIKRVLESLYGFEVEKVQTLNMDGKKKKRGGLLIAKPDYKKAYVTLKNPLSISPDLFPIRVIQEEKKNMSNKSKSSSIVEDDEPKKMHWLEEKKDGRNRPDMRFGRGRYHGEKRSDVGRDRGRDVGSAAAKFPWSSMRSYTSRLALAEVPRSAYIMASLDMSLEDMIKSRRNTERGGRGQGRARRGRGAGGSFRGGSFRGGRTTGAPRRGPLGTFRRTKNLPWQNGLFEDSLRAAGLSSVLESGTKLYVSNLDTGVTNEDIRELFTEIGELVRFAIHFDKNGRPSGAAEVVFARRSDAFQALKRYNNVQLDGKPMKIEIVGSNPEIPLAARVNVVGGTNRRRTVVMAPGGPARGRGGAIGRGSRGRGRGGRGSNRGADKSAEDLDKELENYHANADAMEA